MVFQTIYISTKIEFASKMAIKLNLFLKADSTINGKPIHAGRFHCMDVALELVV